MYTNKTLDVYENMLKIICERCNELGLIFMSVRNIFVKTRVRFLPLAIFHPSAI